MGTNDFTYTVNHAPDSDVVRIRVTHESYISGLELLQDGRPENVQVQERIEEMLDGTLS